ncbi:hypothetical protein FACS189490_01950 [Clostridia bacterium]|nr:hypothetical protein FACS189490_01950 [Clostridia bacterium]
MRTRALQYYGDAYPCACCIFLAGADKYGFSSDGCLQNICEAMSGGFGCGIFCGAAVASAVIFGSMFGGEDASRLTLMFLSEFSERFKTFDCCKLKNGGECCENIIAEAAEIIDGIIAEFKEKFNS